MDKNNNWIQKAILDRDDADQRCEAFMDAFMKEVNTDDEPWAKKARSILHALTHKDADDVFLSMCGWYPASIAKCAMLLRDEDETFDSDPRPAMLILTWADGSKSSSICEINPKTLEIVNFSRSIFKEHDGAEIKMSKVSLMLASGEWHTYDCKMAANQDEVDEFTCWFKPVEEPAYNSKRWIQIWYSWGDRETPIEVPQVADAWEYMKQLVIDEAEVSQEMHDAENGIQFFPEEGKIVLHYGYDDEYCYYLITETEDFDAGTENKNDGLDCDSECIGCDLTDSGYITASQKKENGAQSHQEPQERTFNPFYDSLFLVRRVEGEEDGRILVELSPNDLDMLRNETKAVIQKRQTGKPADGVYDLALDAIYAIAYDDFETRECALPRTYHLLSELSENDLTQLLYEISVVILRSKQNFD